MRNRTKVWSVCAVNVYTCAVIWQNVDHEREGTEMESEEGGCNERERGRETESVSSVHFERTLRSVICKSLARVLTGPKLRCTKFKRAPTLKSLCLFKELACCRQPHTYAHQYFTICMDVLSRTDINPVLTDWTVLIDGWTLSSKWTTIGIDFWFFERKKMGQRIKHRTRQVAKFNFNYLSSKHIIIIANKRSRLYEKWIIIFKIEKL